MLIVCIKQCLTGKEVCRGAESSDRSC